MRSEEETIIGELLVLLQLFIPIPLRTDRSLRAVPYVTYALLFTCLFVHLATLRLTPNELYVFQHRWGLVMEDPSAASLFTHAFIHADWMHLLGNLLLLWIVGTVLEAGIGSLLFALLYFASLMAAVLLQSIMIQLFTPEAASYPMFGASGAIAGITGFAAFRYYHLRVLNMIFLPNLFFGQRVLPLFPIPVPFWIPFWAYAAYFGGKEFLFGITKLQMQGGGDGVAHWAHLGGMTLGLIAAVLLRSYQDGQRESALEQSAKATAGGMVHSESAEEVSRLLQQQPDDPELLEAQAGVALAAGNLAESQAFYLQAVPRFLTSGRADRAAICALNLLRQWPETVLPLREQLAVASALEAQGYAEEAATAFTRLAEQYPEYDEAQNALLRAAQLYQKSLHDTAVARRLLTTLLEEYPNSPWRILAQDRLRALD